MKRIELNAIFTAKVSEYLSNGYTFNTNTMGGSQGEIAHVDLRKNNDVIRILMDSKYNAETICNTIHIIVGRSPKAIRPETHDATIWNDTLEIIDELVFAEVERDWFTSVEEGKTIAKIQETRFEAKRVTCKRTLTPSTEFIRALKNRKGFSSATKKNVIVERNGRGYTIKLFGRDGGIARTANVYFKTK